MHSFVIILLIFAQILLGREGDSLGQSERAEIKKRFTEFIVQSANESQANTIEFSLESAHKLTKSAYSALVSAKIVQKVENGKFGCGTSLDREFGPLDLIRAAFEKEKVEENLAKFENGLTSADGKMMSKEVRNQVLRLYFSFVMQTVGAVNSHFSTGETMDCLKAFLTAHICAMDYERLPMALAEYSTFNDYQFGVRHKSNRGGTQFFIKLDERSKPSDLVKRFFNQLVVDSTSFEHDIEILKWWRNISTFDKQFGTYLLKQLHSVAIKKKLLKVVKKGKLQCGNSFNSGENATGFLYDVFMVRREIREGLEEAVNQDRGKRRALNAQLYSLLFSFATRLAAVMGEQMYLRAFAVAHGCLKSVDESPLPDSAKWAITPKNRVATEQTEPENNFAVLCGESNPPNERKKNRGEFLTLKKLAETPLSTGEALQMAGSVADSDDYMTNYWRSGNAYQLAKLVREQMAPVQWLERYPVDNALLASIRENSLPGVLELPVKFYREDPGQSDKLGNLLERFGTKLGAYGERGSNPFFVQAVEINDWKAIALALNAFIGELKEAQSKVGFVSEALKNISYGNSILFSPREYTDAYVELKCNAREKAVWRAFRDAMDAFGKFSFDEIEEKDNIGNSESEKAAKEVLKAAEKAKQMCEKKVDEQI